MASGLLEEKPADKCTCQVLQNLFHALPHIASIPSLKPGSYLFCNKKMSATQDSKRFYQVSYRKELL